MTSVASGRRWSALLRAWWIADRVSMIRFIGLCVALVSFLFLWPSLIKAGGATPVLSNFVIYGYVMAWLMLVTIGVRSVGSREVVTAFLLGMFLVPLLVFIPLRPVVDWLGFRSHALAALWVPPVEELVLLAVTGLFVWRLCRRADRRPGPLDLFVVGWSIGSGYAIHEDALYGRIQASVNRTLEGAFEGGYGWLFPTFGPSAVGGGYGPSTYHAGSGAIYGLVLAAVILLRRRSPAVWFLVPAVWLYVTFDHALYNHQLWAGLSPWRYLVGNGHVLPVLVVIAVPVLLAFEHWRRREAELPLPAFGWRGVRRAIELGHGFADTLVRLLAYGQYHRARNAALNAARSRREGPPVPVRWVEAWGRLAFTPRDAARVATTRPPR